MNIFANNDKQDLLLATLASIRNKLDNVEIGESLVDVTSAYRSIFNNEFKGVRYDGRYDGRTDEVLAKEQLELDILTEDCGIEFLNSFLNCLSSCWLDFFGSDSFSDSKEKKQIFFATLCKNKQVSDERTAPVKKYNAFLNEKVPVDVFIQLFFSSDVELNKTKDGRKKILKDVQNKGFFVDYGMVTNNHIMYAENIEKYSSCTKLNLLTKLADKLELMKDEGLYKLDYSKFLSPTDFELHKVSVISDEVGLAEDFFLKAICDLNKSLHKDVHYVYFLPIPCPDGSNGLVCFGSEKQLSNEDRCLLDALSFDILYPFVSSYKTAWQRKELFKESIKSAIAAIMSRNMSHNLGSHFISNTKNYFSNLIEQDPGNEKNYRGIKHALQYIQERMNFIATITSTDHYPFGAVNAKAQILDELTPDDFGKRHGQESYNFLMDYLVLSEKISKQSRVGNNSLNKLKLQMGRWDRNENPVFWDPTASSDEDNRKRDEILGINFAIPGGISGRHAVFSIIENIIRNAAKHGQVKIKGDFIVKMLYRTDKKRLIVFDNKNDCDIKGTVDKMNKKLKEMRFLTPEGALEQESKGLKEMLICAIWLQNEDVSQVMTDNDIKNEDDRLKNLNKYLKVVAVDENGKELKENDTKGFLGYSIKLDQYERVHYLKEEELSPECLQNIKADVVCYKEDREIEGKKLSDIFPRYIVIPSENNAKSIGDLEILRRVVENNCGNEAIQRKMVVDYTTDYKYNSNVFSYKDWSQNSDVFLFKGHAGKSKWHKFESLFLTKGFEDKYVDAISGGDFTSTLVQPSFVNDEYNLLKIKESVATRFVIIDERIFEHYKSMVKMTSKKGEAIFENSKSKSKVGEFVFKIKQVLGNGIYSSHEKELDEFVKNTTALSFFLGKDIEQQYLERRGIYVFNLEPGNDGFKMVDLSSNEKKFLWKKVEGEKDEKKKDEWKFDSNDKCFDTKTTTFLSVHLGLIDKIKDQLLMNKENMDKGDIIDKEIVEALKLHFGANFVTIHSGRGGFDIRESLRQYAFQSFSAIENPLYNSKFLLAQQFYTLKYYGTE